MLSWSFLHRTLSLSLVGALVAAGLLITAGQSSPAPSVAAPSEGEPAEVEETAVPLVDGGEEPKAAPDSAQEDEGPAMGGGSIDEPVAELSREDTDPFSLLGVTWEATPGVEAADVEVQWRSSAGDWSEWTTLETSGVAADTEGGRPGTEPMWVGESDGVAVRVATGSGTPPNDLKVVTVSDGETPDVAPAAATVGQPKIISRSQWGATGGSSCSSPVYGSSTLGTTLHHTAGSNSYTKAQSAGIVRSAQAYHIRGQGWCDIGYNILVDKYGQIFEGRKGGVDRQVRGAHAGVSAVNERTLGISMMGNYDTAQPSSAMKTAVADVIAWRHSIAGLKATGTYTLGGKKINRIAGHRDVKATACPGRYGYAWLTASGGLRSLVAKRLDAGSAQLPTPEGLTSTSATTSSLSFAWDAVPGAKRYHVKVSTSSNLSSPVYGKFDTNKGTVSGLKPGTKYFFAVVVVDPAKNVRLSEYTSASNATTSSMSTPTGLRSTSATTSSLSFAWDAVPGAERYHVKVSTSSNLSSPTFGRFDTNKGTVSGLKPGTKYYFAVVVVDPAKNVRLSEYTSASSTSTTSSGGAAMAAPTGLKVTSSTPTSLSFAWNAVSGAKRYHVKVSTSPTMSPPTFGKFDTNKGTVSGLKAGTKYYYSIVVVDPAKNVRLSEYTSPASTSTPNPGGMAMAPPTGLKVTSSTPTSLSFAWNAVSGAKRYHVKVSTSPTMSPPTFGKFDTNKGTVKGLKAGTKYYYAVVVVDPAKNVRLSEYTAASSTSTPAATSARNTLTVPSSRNLAIKGHGYGHGIGMSQYGAQGAARQGEKYNTILAHYYPGTSLATRTGSIRVLLSGITSDSMTVLADSGMGFRQPSNGSRTTLPTSASGRSIDRWVVAPLSTDKKRSVLRYRTSAGWTTYRTFTGDAQLERSGALRIVTPSGTKSYRTALRSVAPTATTRDVVNVLSIEDYTRGVVAREVPSGWHSEALKAQSVAARTYGVRSITSSGRHDICDTTSCQVYGGVAAEVASTDAAVKATAGRILTHGGKPAFTQFSSSSGGHSNVGSQPYLKAVSDPWDNWSGNPNHSWSTTVSAAKVEKAYPAIGTLRSLSITKRNGHGALGGRVSSITLKGSKASRTISGVDARWSFGLKSDWFGF